jgi:hypothetical protein
VGRRRLAEWKVYFDIFHRVDLLSGQNWTFGDLSGPVPPNPGNHMADRYRASFYNRLKRTSSYYADTAKLFGMVNMERLGRNMIRSDVQDTFHFVLNRSDMLHWQTKRAIEHVFYFHPNAQVYVHSNDLESPDFEIFVESGYNLMVQPYNVMLLAREMFGLVMPEMISHPTAVPCLVVWKYGGVFVSKNTFLQQEISRSVEAGITMESDGSVGMVIVAKHSSKALEFLKSQNALLSSDAHAIADMKAPSWRVPVLSESETVQCFEDLSWALAASSQETSLAVSLHPSVFSSDRVVKLDSECYKLMEVNCIYCDEIHWEY